MRGGAGCASEASELQNLIKKLQNLKKILICERSERVTKFDKKVTKVTKFEKNVNLRARKSGARWGQGVRAKRASYKI